MRRRGCRGWRWGTRRRSGRRICRAMGMCCCRRARTAISGRSRRCRRRRGCCCISRRRRRLITVRRRIWRIARRLSVISRRSRTTKAIRRIRGFCTTARGSRSRCRATRAAISSMSARPVCGSSGPRWRPAARRRSASTGSTWTVFWARSISRRRRCIRRRARGRPRCAALSPTSGRPSRGRVCICSRTRSRRAPTTAPPMSPGGPHSPPM
jgi:hypothetical protein